MQSSRHGSRPQVSPLDNAFSPTYLARLRERDDSLTAAEAELAGPWKIEPVPGRRGAGALRALPPLACLPGGSGYDSPDAAGGGHAPIRCRNATIFPR